MKRAFLMVVGLCLLSGCSWVQQQWPWNRIYHAEPAVEVAAVGNGEVAHDEAAGVEDEGGRVVQTTAKADAPAAAGDADSRYEVIGRPKVVEALMLMVNGEIITANEVLHPVRERLRAIPAGISEDDFRARSQSILAAELRRQVGEAMVLREARRGLDEEELKSVDDELNAHVRDKVALVGGSRLKLDAELRTQGTTLEEATNVQRRQMISRAYLRKKFIPQLSTTRQQLWQYYQDNPTEFSSPRQVQMQILSLPYVEFYSDGVQNPSESEVRAAKQAAYVVAEEALSRLTAGEDFGRIINELGRGFKPESGIWDYMPTGSFREAGVEAAAFSQEVGEVSEVIEGERGLFVVKTYGVIPGKVVPFEEAQDDIDNILRGRQYDELTAAFFNELTGKAKIESSAEFEKLLMDRAVQTYHRP